MKWCRGVLRITSITRSSRMPLSLRIAARRSRARCEVIPSPLNADGGSGWMFIVIASGRLLVHGVGHCLHPAADLLQRLVAGQVDMDRRDRHVAAAHRVEVGTGAVVLGAAGGPDPPDRLAARVGLRDARRRAVPLAQAGDLETLDLAPWPVRHVDIEDGV